MSENSVMKKKCVIQREKKREKKREKERGTNSEMI